MDTEPWSLLPRPAAGAAGPSFSPKGIVMTVSEFNRLLIKARKLQDEIEGYTLLLGPCRQPVLREVLEGRILLAQSYFRETRSRLRETQPTTTTPASNGDTVYEF